MWDLAFKAGTDDVRASPSLRLIDYLIRVGAHIRAYDPIASAHVRALVSSDRITLLNDAASTCLGADGLIVMTEWREFRDTDFHVLAMLMRGRVVFDARRLYDKSQVNRAGFQYYVSGGRTTGYRDNGQKASMGGTPLALGKARPDLGRVS